MTFLKADFKGKRRCESLRFCGNCGRVNFCLSAEDLQFLRKMSARYSLRTMRGWLKNEEIKAPGRGRLDVDKTRALKIMREHRIRCWAPSAVGSEVNWCDESCYAWKPRAVKAEAEGGVVV